MQHEGNGPRVGSVGKSVKHRELTLAPNEAFIRDGPERSKDFGSMERTDHLRGGGPRVACGGEPIEGAQQRGELGGGPTRYVGLAPQDGDRHRGDQVLRLWGNPPERAEQSFRVSHTREHLTSEDEKQSPCCALGAEYPFAVVGDEVGHVPRGPSGLYESLAVEEVEEGDGRTKTRLDLVLTGRPSYRGRRSRLCSAR